MRKKIYAWMTFSLVLILLLPLLASASTECNHYAKCIPYTCSECGEYVALTDPAKHSYMRSLFHGFTFCTQCHELQFHAENVNWLAFIPFLLCLISVVVALILIIKNRGSGYKAGRISAHASKIEESPETLAGHSPWAVTGANNPALALNLVKEEEERPEN